DDQLLNLGRGHSFSAPAAPLTGGTSYITSPRLTSSIASRSAFCGSGPSSERIRRRAPRRSCLARSAATSTNRNRLWIGGTGSGGTNGPSTPARWGGDLAPVGGA